MELKKLQGNAGQDRIDLGGGRVDEQPHGAHERRQQGDEFGSLRDRNGPGLGG